ncbi:hypothetical protein WMW72_20635 [Paenibacillus filicis]|uniref:Lipoprotein n=1 Tax=Paenibacillus filicis TaxID=669464 RepID=A0ABU9DN68_9BACL
MKRMTIIASLAVLTLLSGCLQLVGRQTSMPPEPSLVPVPATPQFELKQLQGHLKPDVDEKYPPVSDKNPMTFHYISDIELDRASVEQAVKEQLTSNLTDRKDFDYRIHWGSDQDFTLSLFDLLPREAVHVSLQKAKTKEPGLLNEGALHLFDTVFQYREAGSAPALAVTNFNSQQHRYTEVDAAQQLGLIREVESGNMFTVTSGPSKIQIMDIKSGLTRALPIPDAKYRAGLEQLHGFKNILFPDTYKGDELYVVLSHSEVHRLNIRTQRSEKVYTSPLPILGISPSPDGKMIGLMVAQDQELRAEADLLVINEKGKAVFAIPRAAYISHSDGYLTEYMIKWQQGNTLRITTEYPDQSRAGQKEIDVRTQAVTMIPDKDPDLDMLNRISATEPEITIYLSPDPSKAVYITRSNADFYIEIWMTGDRGTQPRFVGIGRFLGWVSPDEFVWVEYGAAGVR